MQERENIPIRLAVCDDEPTDRDQIVQMAQALLTEERIQAAISPYACAADLLRAIQSGSVFHMLILDVMMTDMDGMSLAAALRAQNEEAAIIFVSSNRELALKGYEVAAARYLAKPLDAQKLREALLYCHASCARQHEVLLPTSKGQSRINLTAIRYAETWERGVRLHLRTETIVARVSISQIASMLPNCQFAYCHRTVLVNLSCVNHIRYGELELKNGERLPLSKYRFAEFKKQFLQYLKA